jgi:thioredoxin 1
MKLTMPVAVLTIVLIALAAGAVWAQCCSSATSCDTEETAEEAKKDPVVKVTDATFAKEVSQAKVYVIVDFWAPWCGPCMSFKPTYHKVAKDYSDAEKKIKFVAVNVDESRESAAKHGIRSIPSLLIFKDGKLVDRRAGACSEAKLKQWIGKYVK